MLSAKQLEQWPSNLSAKEFPEGVLEHLDARVITELVGPLRHLSKIPMWPSAFVRAHIRHDAIPANMHSTVNKTRFSFATDFHVKTYRSMIDIFHLAREIPAIGGLGIYFNLNNPTFHVDLIAERGRKLTWLVTSKEDGAEYVYLERDAARFYRILGEQIAKHIK